MNKSCCLELNSISEKMQFFENLLLAKNLQFTVNLDSMQIAVFGCKVDST